ncbi:hypothetical protein PVAG01_05849 [Phlyctema vagabunda]|uniref:Uncharacterized protein n=1 Tax=Phlyctema vagabunda TaxID=108571 RepID=A0ABR4PEF1_9HELO
MANAWLPRQCYDADAAQKWVSLDNDLVQFDGAGVFDWWQDKNHTTPVAQENLSDLDEAHTIQAYHVAHCLYDWEATLKAMKRVKGGESPVVSRILLLATLTML